MGTFTDNLLKLTEFPFSYSFIGLLALIFGQGLNFGDEEFFARLGPLLILMGFVATTLSITDPIGRLQKLLLVGLKRFRDPLPAFMHIANRAARRAREAEKKIEDSKELEAVKMKIDDDTNLEDAKEIEAVNEKIFEIPVFGSSLRTAVRGMNEKAEKVKVLIPPRVLLCLVPEFQEIRNRITASDWDNPVLRYVTMLYQSTLEDKPDWIQNPFIFHRLRDLMFKIHALKRQTVKTTWIVREVDKITSMIYFIIVIVTFIFSLVVIPGFEDKFIVAFQGGNQTGGAGQNTATGGEVGGVGTRTNPTASTLVVASPQARLIIIIFSIVALISVLIMLIMRLRELRSKALTTFLFLVELDAIRFKRESFDKRLQEIERYLDNGDWTMAGFSVERCMSDYDELLRKEFMPQEEKVGAKEVKGLQGETSIEEDKDVDQK
jgi:hypothetical protein